jgi:hypothetical protein
MNVVGFIIEEGPDMKTFGEIYQPKNITIDDLKAMLGYQQLKTQQEQLQSDFQKYFQDFLCFLEVSPLRDRKIFLKGHENVFDQPIKSFISHLETLAEDSIQTELSSSIASMMEFLLKQMRKDDAAFFQALKNEWLEWINGFKAFKPRQEQIQTLSSQMMDKLQSSSPSHALQESLTITFQFALNQIAHWAKSLSLLPLLNICEYLKKVSIEYPQSRQAQLLKQQLQDIMDNKQTIYQQLKGLIQTHLFNISWIGQVDFEQSYLRHLELKQTEREKNFNLLNSLLRDYLQERETYRDSNGKIKEYFYGYFFGSFQKSYTEKRAAVTCLLKVLNGEQDDLTTHLATLRNGRLGAQLRAFVKQGLADDILGVQVRTVSELVKCLSQARLLDKTL